MPVDTGVLRQSVGDEDAHAITFHHLDRGTWALAVVAPQVGLHARRHLTYHGLCHQVELLDTLVHAPRQGPAVERHHGVVWSPRIGHERRHGVRAGLNHRFGQGRHRHAADRTGSHCPTGDAGELEKFSSGCHCNRLCIKGRRRCRWARWMWRINGCWLGVRSGMPARRHRPARTAAVRPWRRQRR